MKTYVSENWARFIRNIVISAVIIVFWPNFTGNPIQTFWALVVGFSPDWVITKLKKIVPSQKEQS